MPASVEREEAIVGGTAHTFPFISEATAEPHVEALYGVADGKWKRHPDRIGSATVDEMETDRPDRVRLDVRLDFDDPVASVTLEGTGDRVNGQLSRGRLRVLEAKGVSVDKSATIILNVHNPKRWGTDDVP